ncbi:MAG: hypothetical protein KW788_04895 [Candidatus Doudnabacteria bacterium]|nr:hypothetical protein [Candidatus Doudnabacteria bacterium]
MEPLAVHDQVEYERSKATEETQGKGRQVFELSNSAIFLPLRMVNEALRASLKSTKFPDLDAYVRYWTGARIIALEPVEQEPRYQDSGSPGMKVEQELRRIIQVKARADVNGYGPMKVEADCEIYRHPKQDYGWEAGSIDLLFTWTFDGVQNRKYTFENGFDLGDQYYTRVKPM